MSITTEYSRMLLKRGTTSGATPTIPTATTIDNTWIATDIMVGELYMNTATDQLWTRTANGIVEISLSGISSTNSYTYTSYLSGNTIQFGRTDLDPAYNVDLTPILGGSFTGNTSGDCISDIYVSNIHSCSPLHINPLDEGDVFFGSTSGVTIDVINSRIGVGKEPDHVLDIVVGTGLLQLQDVSYGQLLYLSGNSTGLTQMVVSSDLQAGSIGVRGGADTVYTGYGDQGDMFMYSGIDSNGLNIISQPGTGTDDFIRFFAGQGAGAAGTPDLYIQGSGATRGYVALGHDTPTEKLDVLGSIKMVDGNESNGYVLTSDANGVGSWQVGAGATPDATKLPLSGGTMTGNIAMANGVDITGNGGNNVIDLQGNLGQILVSTDNGAKAASFLELGATSSELSCFGGDMFIYADDSLAIGRKVSGTTLDEYILIQDGGIELYTAVGQRSAHFDSSDVFIGNSISSSAESGALQVRNNASTTKSTAVGVVNRAVFIGAQNSQMNASVINSVVMGTDGITGTTSNTTYVQNLDVSGNLIGTPCDFSFAVSDETTQIVTGTTTLTFFAPYAMTITDVYASLSVTGSTVSTFDINNNGTTILSTKITVDANEFHSNDATTPPVISTAAVAQFDKLTVDIDTAGTLAAGAKIYIVGTRT